MKLRNKKTGEIIINNGINFTEGNYKTYNSLAELNEEWEDHEEPKGYWFINSSGGVDFIELEDDTPEGIDGSKQIGNYFETKEEAEKAVEKLKAWKRLKDKGFRFTDDFVYGEYYGCGSIRFIIFPSKKEKYVKDDLDLLFGGEE